MSLLLLLVLLLADLWIRIGEAAKDDVGSAAATRLLLAQQSFARPDWRGGFKPLELVLVVVARFAFEMAGGQCANAPLCGQRYAHARPKHFLGPKSGGQVCAQCGTKAQLAKPVQSSELQLERRFGWMWKWKWKWGWRLE